MNIVFGADPMSNICLKVFSCFHASFHHLTSPLQGTHWAKCSKNVQKKLKIYKQRTGMVVTAQFSNNGQFGCRYNNQNFS
jgi:hypothetical protein